MSLSCGCNGEYPDIWNESYPKARKAYTCVECGKAIEKGDTYHRIDALYDGKWCKHKECEACGDLSASLAALGYCWEFGELRNAHREHIEVTNPPAIDHQPTKRG